MTTDDAGRFEGKVQPGLQLVLHRPGSAGEPHAERLPFVARELLVQRDGGGNESLLLLLRRPAAWLEVQVLCNGEPEPGATVAVSIGTERAPDQVHHLGLEQLTGEDGNTRFALFDLEDLRSVELVATQATGRVAPGGSPLVSEPLQLELPLAPSQVACLRLDTGARLILHVIDGAGAPIEGRQVLAVLPDSDVGVDASAIPRSDESGRIEWSGLPPGEYAVWALETPVEAALRVELVAGETRELTMPLAGGGPRLAVEGIVLDEGGEPLPAVELLLEFGPRQGAGTTRTTLRSGPDGRFAAEAEPSEGIVLSAGQGLSGDEFEPARLELPFGARDVTLRRTRAYQKQEVPLAIVAAGTGERLPSAVLMIHRAPREAPYSFIALDQGIAAPLCSTHPGTTLVAAAPGHRRRSFLLRDVLQQQPEDGLHKLALEPGLLRELQVAGWDQEGLQAPIAGARVLVDGAEVGRTDDAGQLLLDLHLPLDSGLQIEAAGYQPGSWSQAEGLPELEPAWVWLQRQE